MKKIFTISCLILGLFGLFQLSFKIFAEGGTESIPFSGATSRIKIIDDALTVLGFGTSESGAWGDWGTMWNRIYSSAIWDANLGDADASEVFLGKKFYAGANRTLLTGTYSFTGDAMVSDVAAGKTFYADSSTKLTGTYSAPATIDYGLQQYSAIDDASGTGDYQGEESIWTSTVENVWQDTRTGLYWSDNRGAMTNLFTIGNCDFFTTTPRGNYGGIGDTNVDADCGVAINYCATLNFGGKTDWYLPSQKEAMQAFIDGMYNQAGLNLTDAATFTTGNNFWSSSERSNSDSNAWYYNLGVGTVNIASKTPPSSHNVRCVRRD